MKLFANLKNQKGFTLIETMIVVSVMLIVALGAVSSQTKLFRVSAGTEEVIKFRELLMAERGFALAQDKCALVQILDATTVRTNRYDTCSPAFADPQGEIDTTFNSLQLQNFNVGDQFHFMPRGRLDQTVPVTMDIIGPGGKTYQIKIMPAIGSIRLKST